MLTAATAPHYVPLPTGLVEHVCDALGNEGFMYDEDFSIVYGPGWEPQGVVLAELAYAALVVYGVTTDHGWLQVI